MAYVDANRELLLCLIDQVRAIPSSERHLLRSQHRELDEAVLLDGFFSIARQAVNNARELITSNPLAKLLDDDINMILRPIEYAKYLTSEDCPQKLTFSPVQLPL